MLKQKRVAAIHDISCFGKCSLTVALPIISAAGVECSVIPTAVLSTHTGGFTGFTYRDLTTDVQPIADHWKTLDIEFDSIYTGYLGSFEQLELVSTFFDDFKNDHSLILVDPVMADNGVLYQSFPKTFPAGMKKLCSKADVIVPNITEAVLMLNEEYKEGPYTKEYIENLLKKLAKIGPKQVVLTGVYFDDTALGAATYDSETGVISYALAPRVEGYYHGTGDIFGSALLSGLLNDIPLAKAAQIAVDFTVKSITWTKEAGTDLRFGVNFETNIPSFTQALGLK
ncbi:pyridoxamine kinase [Propionispira raffinosivorans]|uniref:pyridoxamine kinase n=1 Tax=Propionispira raffinosivorans TaxID=86959 RepID=UPI000362430F|nr:pyridoxamine kinase [Propionispira raffinosivorans]